MDFLYGWSLSALVTFRVSPFPIELRPLSSLVAHEDVCDGDLEAEVAVPAAVELDVADSLVEVEEAQHPLGRHHVLLVHHHHEVAAADVGEVVLPPLLVLFVMWLIRGVKCLAVL